jgi:hypothetical protein
MPIMLHVNHIDTCSREVVESSTKVTRDRKVYKAKKGIVAEELLRKEVLLYKKKLTPLLRN